MKRLVTPSNGHSHCIAPSGSTNCCQQDFDRQRIRAGWNRNNTTLGICRGLRSSGMHEMSFDDLTRAPQSFHGWPSVSFVVALCTKSYQILGCVIAQAAPRLNVMDLKILHSPARLTSPAISLQDFAAELAISFWIKPQAGPFCTNPSQHVTCTSSRSCFLSGFGRQMTSRVRQGNRASWLPASKLTPARKSAQIISKQ